MSDAPSNPPDLSEASRAEVAALVSDGLKRTEDAPVKSGFADVFGGVSSLYGPFARAEAGYHVTQAVSAYGFAQWTPKETIAGAGVGVTF